MEVSSVIVLLRSIINTPYDGIIFVSLFSLVGAVCLDDEYIERFIKMDSCINKQMKKGGK